MDDTFVIFRSEPDYDHFQEKLNLVQTALKLTVEKKQNNSLNCLEVLVEKQGTGFLLAFTRKQWLLGNISVGIFLVQKARKISLIKTSIYRACMICSKTKLGSKLHKIKQLLVENRYPTDVPLFCINQKLANFAAEKTLGSEKCPVYLKLPWIGNVSSKFENQINKAITFRFYPVKPHVAYNTKVMLPSAKKDSIPTTQKSCVVYQFSCRCEARNVGSTTQRLADRIKQHVPMSIRKKSSTVRDQPFRMCKSANSKINCELAIGQHFITNPKSKSGQVGAIYHCLIEDSLGENKLFFSIQD